MAASSSAPASSDGLGILPVSEMKVHPMLEDQEVATTKSQRKYRCDWKLLICSMIAAIPTLLAGITISIPSAVALDLSGNKIGLSPDFQLSTTDKSVFAALALAGAVFGGPVSGWVADRWGRKFSLMFSCVLYVVGYLLISYAHFASTGSTFRALLQTGRFLSGGSVGWSSTAFSVYIGEISSSSLRGLFGILLTGSTMVGVTLTFALSSIDGFFYFHIALVAVGIVALFEVLMVWMPETPRSLLSRGYIKEAKKALKWLRGSGYEQEFEEIKQLVIESRANKKQHWRSMLKRNFLIPFLYVVVVISVKQFCGFHAITAFAGQIFVDAGIANPRVTVTYVTGVANLCGVVVALLAVDRLGRKPLLISSGLLAALGAIMLGVYFYITSDCDNGAIDTGSASGEQPSDKECSTSFGPLAIVGLIIYNFGYSIGFGPLPWVLASEFIPLAVRGKAVGVLVLYFFVTATLIVGLYLHFVELVTFWFAMWTFATVSLAGSGFVLVFLPETRKQSLETMEKEFKETATCSLHFYCIKCR